MTLEVQFTTITYMILGGIYVGLALETFRRFSPIWQHNRFLVYCLEIFFWLIQTAILFYILYRANNGELRFYVFIACLLGFSMYQAIFASSYKKLLERVIQFVKISYRFFRKTIQMVIIVPIQWIMTLFLKIVNLILLLILYIVKTLFLPIRWIGKLIYFLLPKKIQHFINKLPQTYSIIKNTLMKWAKYMMRR